MDSLVSTDWLAAHWGEEDRVVLDATKHLPDVERDPRSDFEKAHIPGARFLDLASLSSWPTNSARWASGRTAASSCTTILR